MQQVSRIRLTERIANHARRRHRGQRTKGTLPEYSQKTVGIDTATLLLGNQYRSSPAILTWSFSALSTISASSVEFSGIAGRLREPTFTTGASSELKQLLLQIQVLTNLIALQMRQ